jgi:predicted RNA polymerase sigma factor
MLLSLHVVRGVPLAEIARSIRVSKATVSRRILRALASCRAALVALGVTREGLHALARDGRLELSDVLNALLETDSEPGRLRDRDE